MTQNDSPASAACAALKPRDEKFAQLYALGVPAGPAARAAGFVWKGSPEGNAANARRLPQRKKIKARIAELRRKRDEEALAELRHLVHDRLVLWHENDVGDYYEKREEPMFDGNGEVIRDKEGNPLMRSVQRVKDFCDMTPEQRKGVKSLTYTERGRPNLELYSALDANRDLRKMNGLDSATKLEVKDGSELSDADALKDLADAVLDIANKLDSIEAAKAEDEPTGSD